MRKLGTPAFFCPVIVTVLFTSVIREETVKHDGEMPEETGIKNLFRQCSCVCS